MGARRPIGIAVVVLLVVLAGRAGGGPAQSLERRRSEPWPKPPSTATRAHVSRVIDGDTVALAGTNIGRSTAGGRSSRLIGIDTPEVHGSTECYGHEASAFTGRELAGRDVLIDFDVDRTDRYGRALVYVWTRDGMFFNARLAAEGYASQMTIPPNVRYAELFTKLVVEARDNGRGLWGGRCQRRAHDDRRRASTAAAIGRAPQSRVARPASRALDGEPPCAATDCDCGSFASHAVAQRFFERHGGSRSDSHRLDADHDGVACEALN